MIVEDWLGEDNLLGIDIWHKKYQQNEETFDQWLDRVSGGDAAVKDLILKKKFLFGGRILAGRGIEENGRKVSLSNCYVIPQPQDNLESIFDCAKQMARTYSYGGGCGTDLSALAPKGARVRNAAKSTSGATSWMDLYSTTTESVCQEGRRGALMLTLKCDHPDIEEFINIKTDLDRVTKANISVKFTDNFMKAAKNGDKIQAAFTRKPTGELIHKELDPEALLRNMAHNNWMMAEPGALFWDRILSWNLNSNNPRYVITATNPCGEQPLPDGGSCLLGSINLAEFVHDGVFDYDDFEYTVEVAICALNKVLDEGIDLHPLEIQREIARNWRNCGLGIMGLADCLIKMGYTYGSSDSLDFCEDVALTMAQVAVRTSAFLAEKEGSFPECINELIADSDFIKALDLNQADMDLIKKNGLRNCALLTIAPTGTLSTMIGVSGGIEPIFSNSYTRKTESLNGAKEPVYYKVYTPIVKQYMENNNIENEEDLPEYFVTAHDIYWQDRINMQAIWQNYIDASISSTLNLPNEVTEEEVYNIYMKAWEAGLKGITVYRDGCSRQGILTTDAPKGEDNDKTDIVFQSLARGEIIPSDDNLIGLKRKLMTGCGSLHCAAFFDPECGELREIYLSKGSTGGCNNFMIGLSRMISMAARGGIALNDIIDQLMSTGACPSYAKRAGTSKGSCCPMAVGFALKEMSETFNDMFRFEIKNDRYEVVPPPPKNQVPVKVNSAKCPECGEPLTFEGGCNICKACGWSKCG